MLKNYQPNYFGTQINIENFNVIKHQQHQQKEDGMDDKLLGLEDINEYLLLGQNDKNLARIVTKYFDQKPTDAIKSNGVQQQKTRKSSPMLIKLLKSSEEL
jgi:hypothetical protein